jgi:hypothetical protein
VRRFLGVAALVGLLGVPFFATETACFPQSACDGSVAVYCPCGAPDCGGRVLDDGLTWVSGPIEGPWLPFPHERVWTIDPRDASGKRLRGRITSLEVFISATQDHALSAPAAGNNAQWTYSPASQTFNVQNDTCSDYFVYVVAHSSIDGDAGAGVCPVGCDGGVIYPACIPPKPGTDAGSDAGTDADASPDTGAD